MELAIGVAGWVGMALLVGAYALITSGKLVARDALYQAMNLVGGFLLMINSAFYTAWPSAALNFVWLGIGVSGLIQARRRNAGVGQRHADDVPARD